MLIIPTLVYFVFINVYFYQLSILSIYLPVINMSQYAILIVFDAPVKYQI